MLPACATATLFASFSARFHRAPCELRELWGHDRLSVSGTVNAAGISVWGWQAVLLEVTGR